MHKQTRSHSHSHNHSQTHTLTGYDDALARGSKHQDLLLLGDRPRTLGGQNENIAAAAVSEKMCMNVYEKAGWVGRAGSPRQTILANTLHAVFKCTHTHTYTRTHNHSNNASTCTPTRLPAVRGRHHRRCGRQRCQWGPWAPACPRCSEKGRVLEAFRLAGKSMYGKGGCKQGARQPSCVQI